MKKNAQEEIVGFFMVVIVVSVIVFIFLGFLMWGGNEGVEIKSALAQDFLTAIMASSSNCSIRDDGRIMNVESLFSSCWREEKCLDGNNPCQLINQTLIENLENALDINSESYFSGYQLRIVQNTSQKIKLNGFSRGDCQGNIRGGDRVILLDKENKLNIFLDICTR